MDGLAFISYSREDKDRVKMLVEFLSQHEIPVWWDDKLFGGEKFSAAKYYYSGATRISDKAP